MTTRDHMKPKNNVPKNAVRTKQDITKLGTIMGIWAHPDDETFTSAGIMAAALANGQKVICVTATKGEAGVQNEQKWPAEKLGDIRAKELQAAFELIGPITHIWLDCKDGLCAKDTEHAKARIKSLIEEYRPDTILTFGKEGMTGHDDHRTVHLWAVEAATTARKRPTVYTSVQTLKQYHDYLKKMDEALNIYFNIDKPVLMQADDCDICFNLDSEMQAIKNRALLAMPSQMEQMFNSFGEEYVSKALSQEAFVKYS